MLPRSLLIKPLPGPVKKDPSCKELFLGRAEKLLNQSMPVTSSIELPIARNQCKPLHPSLGICAFCTLFVTD
ncbi:hypothetical protein DUNSADRAFT_4615 [Dunaliella salina]|uniref:Encoded protein n=1 Tax=Dunaliella salina TaxID=3046 RepID=A0ABQ7FVL1_DUNSA|nr:hypothetical protein DUNSADRAFT_4615 [Dunaliella salina]|eukprot:KAF5826137.1 hypothetical protein DUNSADRAFT_4615 [Dunaliella salina]